jgi:hypothetical protein
MLVLRLTGWIDTIGQLLRDILLSISEGVITMRLRTSVAPWPKAMTRTTMASGERM